MVHDTAFYRAAFLRYVPFLAGQAAAVEPGWPAQEMTCDLGIIPSVHKIIDSLADVLKYRCFAVQELLYRFWVK